MTLPPSSAEGIFFLFQYYFLLKHTSDFSSYENDTLAKTREWERNLATPLSPLRVLKNLKRNVFHARIANFAIIK